MALTDKVMWPSSKLNEVVLAGDSDVDGVYSFVMLPSASKTENVVAASVVPTASICSVTLPFSS
jgi:hypothetical protein